MNKQLVNAFNNNDINTLRLLINSNEDKQEILNYAKNIKGGNLTLMQGWILQELNNIQDNELGLYAKQQ